MLFYLSQRTDNWLTNTDHHQSHNFKLGEIIYTGGHITCCSILFSVIIYTSKINLKFKQTYVIFTAKSFYFGVWFYSEEESKIAARKFARKLQRLGYKVTFTNFRIVNVLGTCGMPFRIKIAGFSQKYPKDARY